MRHLKFGLIVFSILIITNCEKRKEDLVNLTTNAQIVGFVTEKCYCCWGWIINIGSKVIKADSIPGLSTLENLWFPINARITIGAKSRDCSEYNADMTSYPDYYEINQFEMLK